MAPNARTKFALGLLSGSGLLEVFLISLYEVVMRFRREVPQAVYVHCHAHWLNLVLVDCVSNVEPAGEFFLVVQMLLHFFSDSVAHSIFPKKQVELEPTEKLVELKSLLDTRWACQYIALCAIKKSLPAILSTVTDVIKLPWAKRRTEAQLDEEFALQLIFFWGFVPHYNVPFRFFAGPGFGPSVCIESDWVTYLFPGRKAEWQLMGRVVGKSAGPVHEVGHCSSFRGPSRATMSTSTTTPTGIHCRRPHGTTVTPHLYWWHR